MLLWGLAAWFGYDGWINQDPDMLEHVAFNRWGFGILVVLGLYFTIQSLRDARARKSEGSKLLAAGASRRAGSGPTTLSSRIGFTPSKIGSTCASTT